MGFFKKIFGKGIGGLLATIGLGLTGYGLLAPAKWAIFAGMGVSFIGELLSKPQMPNFDLNANATGHLLNTKRAGDYVPVVYGNARVGGNIIYASSQETNNKALYQVIGLCMANSYSGNDIVKVNNLFFDGEHQEVFDSLDVNSSSKIEYTIKSDITWLKIKVQYTELTTVEGTDVAVNAYRTFEIQKGTTDTNGGLTVAFSSSTNKLTVTADTTTTTSVSNVKLLSFKTTGDWVQILTNYYDYVYYNGKDWMKFDSTTNDWVVDSAAYDGSSWTGTPSDVRKTIIEDGFQMPQFNIAFIAIKLTYDYKKWQKIPVITADIARYNQDGDSTWTVAECIKDFMVNTDYGLGFSSSKINTASYNIMQSYCEQYSYYFNGVIRDGRASEIIKNLCDHIRVDPIYIDGEYKFKIFDLRDNTFNSSNGINTISTTLDEDDIVEGTFQFAQPSYADVPNRARVKFFNPALDYKVDTYEFSYTGTESEDDRFLEVNLWGYNKSQAEYFATYYLERARLTGTISFVTTHKYIDLEVDDLIQVSYSAWGISNQTIRVKSLRPSPHGTIVVSGVLESVDLYDADMNLDIYSIDLTTLLNPYDEPPDVTNLTISNNKIINPGFKLKNYLTVTWDYDNVWLDYFEIWVKAPDETSYSQYGISTENFAEIEVKQDGDYYVKVVPVTIFGSKKGVSSVTTETNTAINETIFQERVVAWNNYLYTSYTETMEALAQLYTTSVHSYYIGENGGVYQVKNFHVYPTTITKSSKNGIYYLDKSNWKIYRIFNNDSSDAELIHSFTKGTDQYACSFEVSPDGNNYGIVSGHRDSSANFDELHIDYSGSAGGGGIAYSLTTARSDLVSDLFYFNNNFFGIFYAHDSGTNQLLLLMFIDSSTTYTQNMSSSLDIYNRNRDSNDYLLGVAFSDYSSGSYIKILYCYESGGYTQIKQYKYNISSGAESECVITTLAYSNLFIEDSDIVGLNIRLLLKSKTSSDRYIAGLHNDNSSNIVFNSIIPANLYDNA